MKIIQQLVALGAFSAVSVSAFSPASPRTTTLSSTTAVSMGLFDGIMDYFSDEAKAKREEEKQRMLEEQEAAYREVLERRRNPEMMEEYMEQRKERLKSFESGSNKKANKDE